MLGVKVALKVTTRDELTPTVALSIVFTVKGVVGTTSKLAVNALEFKSVTVKVYTPSGYEDDPSLFKTKVGVVTAVVSKIAVPGPLNAADVPNSPVNILELYESVTVKAVVTSQIY